MSQIDSPPFGAPAGGPQKTSGLAIASFVCALICCIPLTTVPAILLGIAAMISIGGDPAKKGKGLAIAGIVLGVVFSVMQALFYPTAISYFRNTMELVFNGPDTALTAGFAGDTAGFKNAFYGAGATASDAEATAFIAALRDRYGEYVESRLDEAAAQGAQTPFGQTSVEFPYIIEFTNGEVHATVKVVFSDPSHGGIVNKIEYIHVTDEKLGDLAYPADTKEMLEKTAEDQPGAPEMPKEPAGAPAGGEGG
jgi:hypothetical protein